MARAEFSLKVVGVEFPNKKGPGRRFEVELSAPGERVELRPEPKNPADRNAIAVYSERDVQLGYIPADRTWLIRRAYEAASEIRAIFQERASWGAIVRVAIGGGDPTLPVPTTTPQTAASPSGDDEFWPDDEYPDDFSQVS